MRRSMSVAALAALAVGSLAFDLPYTPVLEVERTYAHCGDVQKVSNVEDTGVVFASDTDAPAASFTAGGGCGTADAVLSPAENEAGEYLQFTASHTGNLDAFTLELHMIDAGVVRLSETVPTSELPDDPTGGELPGLAFDEIWADTQVFVTDADGDLVGGFTGEATYPSERSASGASTRLRLTVTDLGLLDEDEFDTYTVTVKVKTSDYYNGDSGGWVLDATEVPTGITFNPAQDDWAPYQEAAFTMGE